MIVRFGGQLSDTSVIDYESEMARMEPEYKTLNLLSGVKNWLTDKTVFDQVQIACTHYVTKVLTSGWVDERLRFGLVKNSWMFNYIRNNLYEIFFIV